MALPLLIFGIALITGSALVYFWTQILSFVRSHIMPWVHENFPEFAEKAELAFEAIDKKVVQVKRAIKEAWRQLRRKLLKVLMSYEQNTSGWVRNIISWCIKKLEDKEKIIKRTEVVEVNYEDLPDDVRAAWLRGEAQTEQDVTAARDEQLLSMEVS
jgi:hypothetical protein